jgi:hypothetical protein
MPEAGKHRVEEGGRFLTVLLGIAFVVSVVHYADNYVNYGDYPRSDTLPNPSDVVILASWFAFTAAGLAGYALFRRGPTDLALLLLAVYSGSGLVGIGHYTVAGATGMPWWRQLHIVADIGCGLAILGFALWVVTTRRDAVRAPEGSRSGPRSS